MLLNSDNCKITDNFISYKIGRKLEIKIIRQAQSTQQTKVAPDAGNTHNATERTQQIIFPNVL